jgi:hypothetical protein
LRRGVEGSAGALRGTRNLQHGLGEPVHELRLHNRPAERGNPDQHGRSGPLDGQCLHRAAVAVVEI